MHTIKRINRFIMIPVSLLTTLAGILAFLAGYISPSACPFLMLWSLGMPLILLFNLILAIYWGINKKYWTFLSLAILFLNMDYLLSIFQITLSSSPTPAGATTFKIASYNVKTFKSWNNGYPTQFDITRYLQNARVDIACFQEYYNAPRLNADSLGKLMDLPYTAVSLLKNTPHQGTAIFSKYPITGQGNFPFDSPSNNAFWIDILIDGYPIRIINCHLETTNFNQKRKDIHIYAHADASNQIAAYENIAETLKNNTIQRAIQARMIHQLIDTTPHPVIVCGDFNDPPSSYTYHQIKKKLKDSFRSQGNGYAYTYRGIRHLLRIDYILYSPHLECLAYFSEEKEWSDHNPVICTMLIPRSYGTI